MKSIFYNCSKITIILSLLLTCSCSVKTIYNNLDYLIPYYIDDMVTLDALLEKKVDQRTFVFIEWHRHTQLYQYADFLRTVQADVNNKLTEDKVLKHITTLNNFMQKVLDQANLELANFLPLLDAEQRDELFSNIDDKNEDFQNDYIKIDNDERIEQYSERMINAYEEWLDELTNEQKKIVERIAGQMTATAKLRLERRLQWQNSIKLIINTNDDTKTKSEALNKFFTVFSYNHSHNLHTINNNNQKLFAALTVQIVKSMTGEQKNYYMTTTKEYIDLFTELAQKR